HGCGSASRGDGAGRGDRAGRRGRCPGIGQVQVRRNFQRAVFGGGGVKVVTAAEPAAARGGDQGGKQQAAHEKARLVRVRLHGGLSGQSATASQAVSSSRTAKAMRVAVSRWVADSGWSGRRRPWPIPCNCSNALTGIGFGSTPRKSLISSM